MKKRIVVLGAGIGGVVVASELARRTAGRHEVLVIDREAEYKFAPSYLWLMTGKRSLAGISVPIKKLERKGVQFVHGVVEALDPERKAVTVNGRSIEADVLVIALGANTHMDGLAEVAQAGINLYTSDGAERIRDTHRAAAGKKVVVLVCSMPFKCPAAPYEAAMLLQSSLGGARSSTELAIYTPEPGPMPVAGEVVSKRLVQMLDTKGIKYFPKHTVVGLSGPKSLRFQDDSHGEFDFLVYIPKHRVPEVLVRSGLAAEGGWVPVDRHTLQTKFPDVYALGDATGIPLKNGKSLPKAGVFAHGQAEVVAHNIAAKLTGAEARDRFDGNGSCFVEMGRGIASRGSGNFYAEPDPQVGLAVPGPWNHWAKILFEKYWLNFVY